MTPQPLTFTGQGRAAAPAVPGAPTAAEPYVVTDPLLVTAVNLAIFLRRPLLLEGEAGSGKSRLARAVAYELNLPLFTWPVRSTSKAQEGLYSYDAILRLHDAQTQRLTGAVTAGRDPGDPRAYRSFGALGQAFQQRERPAVVLIDEIDKADVDFPNDLLTVLDDPWSFPVPETGEPPIAADYDPAAGRDNRPIVIITSNKEKGNLPAPFLRRCIYHYVAFPNDKELLRRIVAEHYQRSSRTPPTDDDALAWAERFLALRADDVGLFKRPGVSEFLDWVRALAEYDATSPPVPASGRALPYRGLLLKQRLDWQAFNEPDAGPRA
jgi:MoxR-like ATPase